MNRSPGWDAIVVGAGPAGCVAAARLGASGRRVLLLEAGPGEPRPTSVAGMDVVAAAEESTRQWPGFHVRAEPDGQSHRYRQGRGLGGGSMINSLLLSPGDDADYRRWESDLGCGDWGPQAMAPWLERAAAAFAGTFIEPGPFSAGFSAAAHAAGHPVGGSTLDQGRLGVLRAALAVVDRSRRSAVDAYVPQGVGGVDASRRPAIGSDAAGASSGLTIMTGTAVSRILTAGDRAIGVSVVGGGEFRAPLVVVGAGALRTPQLLIRSGLASRPVGLGFKDHPSFTFTVSLRRRWLIENSPALSPTSATPRTVSTVLRWSSGDDHHGDLQAFVIDRVDDRAFTVGPPTSDAPSPMAVVVVGLMEVSSAGSVAVDDVTGELDVVTGALQTADDRRRLRHGVIHIAGLLRSAGMEAMVDDVLVDDIGTPLDRLLAMSEPDMERWIAAHPGPYAHPVGTCPMGPASSPASVVSSEPGSLGRLLDHEGIHVVDASVFPELVQAGLQLPIAAVADRISTELAS